MFPQVLSEVVRAITACRPNQAVPKDRPEKRERNPTSCFSKKDRYFVVYLWYNFFMVALMAVQSGEKTTWDVQNLAVSKNWTKDPSSSARFRPSTASLANSKWTTILELWNQIGNSFKNLHPENGRADILMSWKPNIEEKFLKLDLTTEFQVPTVPTFRSLISPL